jgi:hypothetical protein
MFAVSDPISVCSYFSFSLSRLLSSRFPSLDTRVRVESPGLSTTPLSTSLAHHLSVPYPPLSLILDDSPIATLATSPHTPDSCNQASDWIVILAEVAVQALTSQR